MVDATSDISSRTAGADDVDAIVALCGRSLGWSPSDPNEELFTWKHLRNPFGVSPMWVAESDGQIVAVRAMMRWELVAPSGRVLRAVRAVDTATAAEHRGKGLFRRLTTGAVEALAEEGVDLVFNTPNDQSRPGYLSMGWKVIGRLPVGLALGSPVGAARLRSARQPARKWSEPTRVGVEAGAALGDERSITSLVASLATGSGLRTRRSAEQLRWRYADGPVRYRVCTLGADPAEGLAVFRLRRRGASVEAVVNEILVPGQDRGRATRRLVWTILRNARPDHLLVACPEGQRWRGPAVRVRDLGPIVTWRPLASTHRPSLADWNLEMGDVELF